MNCVNHEDEPASYIALMPCMDKQPDGSYKSEVPLCDRCAGHVSAIGGFHIKQANKA